MEMEAAFLLALSHAREAKITFFVLCLQKVDRVTNELLQKRPIYMYVWEKVKESHLFITHHSALNQEKLFLFQSKLSTFSNLSYLSNPYACYYTYLKKQRKRFLLEEQKL